MGLFSKKEEWIIVWNKTANWNIVNNLGKPAEGDNLSDIKHCHYIIEHCIEKDKYRLRTEGYRADEHGYYETALKKLSEFQTKGLYEIITERVLKELEQDGKN